MLCPFCREKDTSVIDSRATEDGTAIRRRRLSSCCNQRFTTFERVQFRELTVIKKNGRKSQFDRDKLTRSINIADPNIEELQVTALNFFPNPGVSRPVIDNISIGGNLRAGIYSYCYFFTAGGGNTTVIAPISQQIHIVEEMPLLGSGKIDYRKVADLLKG